MRVISSIVIVSTLLCACQPIVPEQPPTTVATATEPALKPAPTAVAEPAQTPDPHADAMWPDMRYTEPLKVEEFEIAWAVAAAQADMRDLIGTEFEAEVEGEQDGFGLALFYYSSLLHAQAVCSEDDIVVTELIDQHAARIGPRMVAEAEKEDWLSPPLARHTVLMALFLAWKQPLGYLCMDRACLADVKETKHCGDWLERNLDCLFEEDPNACME